MCFLKINHLKLTTEYQALSQKGKRKSFSLFNILYCLDKNNHQPPQIAIVVGSNVSSLSTQRHRVKRLLTEAIRPLISALPSGLKLALFAKKEILKKNFGEINETISFISHSFLSKIS